MKVFVVSCIMLSVAFAHAVPSSPPTATTFLQECFDSDSISCVQNTIYRRAREFFDQKNIEFVGGISFAKSNERSGKSFDEPQVESATTVQARELALEDYLLSRVKNFFAERQISWDFANAGRSLANAIPTEMKEAARELVSEGRTKKKILKKILPLLGLLKLKVAALAVLAIAGIAIIAKKALITSLIAIAIAGAGALSGAVSKLLGRNRGGAGVLGGISSGSNVEEYIAFNAGQNNGWNSAPSTGWNNYEGYGEHGAHSQPIAQQIAYNGHKAVRR